MQHDFRVARRTGWRSIDTSARVEWDRDFWNRPLVRRTFSASVVNLPCYKKKRGRERERKGRKGRGKEGRKELACHWASLLNWVNEAMDPKRWVEPLVRRSRTGPENSLGKVSIHHAVIHAPCFLLFALSSWFNFSPSFVVLYACVYVDRDRSVHYGSRIDECVSNRFSC